MRYQDMPEDERALEFPARFPVKAMGKPEFDVRGVMLEVLQHCEAQYAEHDIREHRSKTGKYVSITVVITATSRQQLDNIYEGLADRPEILMTL